MTDVASDAEALYLSSADVIEVAARLSAMLPPSRSDRLEEWLCVRYHETAAARSAGSPSQLPDGRVELRIASCIEFADAYFGMLLDPTHPYFLVFKAGTPRAWPTKHGSNNWPSQSFWQRFKELGPTKRGHRLFDYEHATGFVRISTRKEVEPFTDIVLGGAEEEKISVLDLAQWFARAKGWTHPPSDVEVVGHFLQHIWITDAEGTYFDAPSNELLLAAKEATG